MKTLKQIREASGGKEAYQKFFNSLLKKFGVDSPSELSGDKKKKFFNAVDKGWEGDDPNDKNETVKEAKKLKGGKGKAEIDINWDGDRKDAKFATTKYKIKLKPHAHGAILTGDKQKILAYLQGQDYAMDPKDIEDLYPELMETYDDPDNLDPDTTHNPDEVELATEAHNKDDDEDMDDLDPDTTTDVDEKAPPGMEAKVKELKKDHSDEEAFAIAWSIHNKKNEAVKMLKPIKGKLGKTYPVMNMSQKKKIIAIAKKHSGNMQRAMKEIDKIRKNLTDNPDVMDILKKANESVKEGVGVDNRTLGFKAAMLRREKAKKVREKSKLKKEKKKEQEVLDARYDYDGGVDVVLATANKRIFGETGANAVAHGGVDMAPNAGKKKKKSKVIKRYNY
jgi:hypothetical protein